MRKDYALTLAAGLWAVNVPAADTTAFVVGQAQAEIAWTDADGVVRITPLDPITVRDSLTANEAITDKPLSLDEQMLAAANQALLTASGDTSISVGTPGGQSISFETRGDLMTFISRLELRVSTRNGEQKDRVISLWG